jgi:hypothetical protein
MIKGMLQAELEEHLKSSDTSSKDGTYPKIIRSDSIE